MKKNASHWTASSTKKFLYRIASDFIEQLRDRIETLEWSQKRLARELKLSEGRISQVLNNPGNLTIETMIDWARTLGMKVSIVAYYDDDPENERGPVNADIFRQCWINAGAPRDFLALRKIEPQRVSSISSAIVSLSTEDACSINGINHRRLGLAEPLKIEIEKTDINKETRYGRSFAN